MTTAIQKKFAQAREDMTSVLIERDQEIDLILTALIAQENPLFVGPPGTAKTLMGDSLFRWINGNTRKFTILMTKFTTPEEVFGPISVKGLKEDRYCRITTGKLPEADLAITDEIFKSSSAIANTLLKAMNERTFENGDGTTRDLPLLMLVGLSNEFPDDQNGGKELGAFFDRFLIRKKVNPIKSHMGRKKLLWTEDLVPKFRSTISRDEIVKAHEEAMTLKFATDAVEAFQHILEDMAKDGIVPGDRRQRKSVNVCKAHAYLCGGTEVTSEHLTVLAHTLWDDPTEQPEKVMRHVLKNATPMAMLVNDILMTVEDVIAKCTPTEAVPKLQQIKKELDKIEDSEHKRKAVNYVKESIAELYRKVVGDVN